MCPLPLCLCLNDLRDFSGFQAARADSDALSLAGDLSTHGDEIRKPAPPRELVRVTDRVADGGVFPTNVAPLSHHFSFTSEPVGRRAPFIARRRS